MSFNVRLWLTKRHNFWLSKTFGLNMTVLNDQIEHVFL